MLRLATKTSGTSVFAPALSPGSAKGVLITDFNLEAMGEGGVLSRGVSASTIEPDPTPETALPGTGLDDWRDRYSEQRKTIRELEQDLARSTSRLPPPQSSVAATGSPHFADPGVVSTNGRAAARNRELTEELAAERQRLEALRAEGRRIGIQPGELR
jgi:hypothetical protein